MYGITCLVPNKEELPKNKSQMTWAEDIDLHCPAVGLLYANFSHPAVWTFSILSTLSIQTTNVYGREFNNGWDANIISCGGMYAMFFHLYLLKLFIAINWLKHTVKFSTYQAQWLGLNFKLLLGGEITQIPIVSRYMHVDVLLKWS